MMSIFSMLDRKSGALTVLTILWHYHRPMPRGELIHEAKRESLGRSALYSALDALRDAGLIEERSVKWEGKRMVTTQPTERGLAVAEKLIEIRKILDA